MFVEINNNTYNIYMIQSLGKTQKDSKYLLCYTMSNGSVLIEEFDSEEACNTKFNSVKTKQASGSGGGGISSESDPTVPSYVKSISEDDIAKWNSNTGSSDSMFIDISYDLFYNITKYPDSTDDFYMNYNTDGSELYSNILTPISDIYDLAKSIDRSKNFTLYLRYSDITNDRFMLLPFNLIESTQKEIHFIMKMRKDMLNTNRGQDDNSLEMTCQFTIYLKDDMSAIDRIYCFTTNYRLPTFDNTHHKFVPTNETDLVQKYYVDNNDLCFSVLEKEGSITKYYPLEIKDLKKGIYVTPTISTSMSIRLNGNSVPDLSEVFLADGKVYVNKSFTEAAANEVFMTFVGTLNKDVNFSYFNIIKVSDRSVKYERNTCYLNSNMAYISYSHLPRCEKAPTLKTELVTKDYVDNMFKSITGYDATKTQVLKHVSGVLQWVTEE